MNGSCETKESCFEKMKLKVKGFRFQIIGIVAGAIGGYIYYLKIGCLSGTCPITSNPFISVLWGGVMGYLVANIFTSKKKEAKPE
jgi:hypothetical protein